MVRTIISSQFKVGKGSGLFRYPLLRLGAVAGVAGVVLVVTLFVASSTLAARRGSNSAAGVQYFQGVKTCSTHNASPLITCVFTTSNVPLRLGAEIAYISNPPIVSDPTGGHIDSDVVLTTTPPPGGEPSTADGHCTFYLATLTGSCIYTQGTNSLAGFHATLMIGPTLSGGAFSLNTFSAIGKYWFDNNGG